MIILAFSIISSQLFMPFLCKVRAGMGQQPWRGNHHPPRWIMFSWCPHPIPTCHNIHLSSRTCDCILYMPTICFIYAYHCIIYAHHFTVYALIAIFTAPYVIAIFTVPYVTSYAQQPIFMLLICLQSRHHLYMYMLTQSCLVATYSLRSKITVLTLY